MAAKENLVDKVNKALGSGGSLAGTDKSYTTHYSRIAALLDKYTAEIDKHNDALRESVGTGHKKPEELYVAILRHMAAEAKIKDVDKINGFDDLNSADQDKIRMHLRDNYNIQNEGQLRSEIIGELSEGVSQYRREDVESILTQIAGRRAQQPLNTAISAMVAEPDYMKHAQPKGHVRKFVHHALDHIGIKKRIRSYASPEAVSNALGEASQEQYRKAREGNRSY